MTEGDRKGREGQFWGMFSFVWKKSGFEKTGGAELFGAWGMAAVAEWEGVGKDMERLRVWIVRTDVP